MSKFTKESVLGAMEEILAELGPDYTYPIQESIHVLTEEEYNASADIREILDYEDYLASAGRVCSYVSREGNPSCIIGRVVAKLNPEAFERIAKLDQTREFGVSSSQFSSALGYSLDTDVMKIMYVAQTANDQKEPLDSVVQSARKAAQP